MPLKKIYGLSRSYRSVRRKLTQVVDFPHLQVRKSECGVRNVTRSLCRFVPLKAVYSIAEFGLWNAERFGLTGRFAPKMEAERPPVRM